MKRSLFTLLLVLSAIVGQAQTLNLVQGSVTTQFPASQAGDMTYSNSGQTLTILNKAYTVSEIDYLYIDETEVEDNTVSIAYSGTSATVTIAGNVAQYVEASVSGAHVTIAQSNTDAVDGDEITYVLSGTTTDGEFALSGSYKCTVSLAGVTLTNPSGAAINITNKKRIQVSAKKGTDNTLTDSTNGSQKACLYSKGQIQLQGNGTLNVYGKTAHAIKSGDYITVKNLTLNVLSAVSDGINCNGYFQLKSGTVSISGVSDDGIQCDLDGTTSTGETEDHDDEDSGNVYIDGGTLTVSVTGAATKGVKAEGDLKVSDGTISVTTSGNGTYDSDEKDAKGSAGLKCDGDMTISGGTLTLKNTGSGGKCIKADGTLTVTDGTITATNSGSQYRYSSSYTASAKAIKAGVRTGSNKNSYVFTGGIVIKGGTITATASSHEAIESKSTIDISGGYVYAQSSDDAINSASTFNISGGYVMGYSTGNDGLDANGNFNISGGVVYAIGTKEPEVSIDANTEDGYKLTVTGGVLFCCGPLESGSTLTQSCYSASSINKNTWYALTVGSTTYAFKTPSSLSVSTLVVSGASQPTVKSGVTVSSGNSIWGGYGYEGGATVSGGTTVSTSSYTSSGGGNQPGGGGNQPGGGGGRR